MGITNTYELMQEIMPIKYLTVVLLILSALEGADGSTDDEFIAFSPIPECAAEYFLDNPIDCDC